MKVHMSLPAIDLKKTADFYSVLFGESPVKVKSDYIKFDPKTVALNISFHPINGEKVDTSQHLGFEFNDQSQLNDLYARLKNAGLIYDEKKESICCYANQDKFWVQDPTGFKWEFYTLLKNTDQKIDAGSNCCAPDQSKGDQVESKTTCC